MLCGRDQKFSPSKAALKGYGKLIWESVDIMLIYYIGHDFYIFSAFDFYAIPLSIYDVIYDTTTIPEDTLL